MGLKIGKKSDMINAWVPVVAGALNAGDGRWLMHRRPEEKHHGGLWEFPGGKLETAEYPREGLIRELHEELGIRVESKDCQPTGFAEEAFSDGPAPIVILLYTVTGWQGEPAAPEGGGIGWFTPPGLIARYSLGCSFPRPTTLPPIMIRYSVTSI